MIVTLAVSGWRGNVSQEDAERIERALARFEGIATVVGDATGVDAIVRAFVAPELLTRFIAYWGRHGRAAGPIRNGEMLAHAMVHGPALLLAFPHHQNSMGTWNAIKQATTRGMPTRIYPIGMRAPE